VTRRICLLQKDESHVEMKEQGYRSDAFLQERLAKHGNILACEQERNPSAWASGRSNPLPRRILRTSLGLASTSLPRRRCTARWTCRSGWSRGRRSHKLLRESGEPKEDTITGQDNLHIAREIFAAWNAHNVSGFVKRFDARTT
jgi:hypothetical protein